ncbi:MAG: SUMF1/EgtB/PvdO family nonheme iron enzyme, partial [Blastocatellia bacterium]|nr:SUMF1/EgtB/PvdO family nonheme iron enzyme [Blastocatellia bacterium]
MNQVGDAFVAGQLMPLDPDCWQITAGFVYIPKGEFMMGSESSDWEKPVHKVIISKSFEMCRYQITQQQWQAVMGKNPSKFR